MPWINVFRLFFVDFAICGVFLDFVEPLVYVEGEKGVRMEG
jgi:hypothetical protein